MTLAVLRDETIEPAQPSKSMGGCMNRMIVAVTGALLASTAYAGQVVPIPEPGVLELLALGAAVAAVIAIRSRRK